MRRPLIVALIVIALAFPVFAAGGVKVPTWDDHAALVERVDNLEERVAALEEEPEPEPSPEPSPEESPSPEPEEPDAQRGPREIDKPAGAIDVAPGELAAANGAASSGDVLWLQAGTHNLTSSFQPKSGVSYIGEFGAVLHGNDQAEYAFANGRSNVHIENLVIRNFVTPIQKAAVNLGGGGGSNVTASHLEVRNNLTGGVHIGRDGVLTNSRVIRNGQLGLRGSNADGLVANNEVAHNNKDPGIEGWERTNPGWEAGGSKFVHTTRLTVRDNYVHNNDGPGLWTDINNIHTLYEHNVVEDNTFAGIFHEISYDAVIRDNVVRGNGCCKGFWRDNAGILVIASPNVEITGNVVEDNGMGISVVPGASRPHEPMHGPWEVENLHVHGNTIRHLAIDCTWTSSHGDCRGYAAGLGPVSANSAFYCCRNNRFEDNTYVLDRPDSFWWAHDWQTPSGWQSFGNDVTGSFTITD